MNKTILPPKYAGPVRFEIPDAPRTPSEVLDFQAGWHRFARYVPTDEGVPTSRPTSK